ncbi:MAG: VWA domain-containing protein [Vicinamibacteria bacterium]|nr:VWA domain-containing protein [Vicinamibacteria bacterium]
MVFLSPAWLWALLALPIMAAIEAWLVSRDRERTARIVSRALWTRIVLITGRRRRFVRLGLLLCGTAGVVLALARPQWGIVREKIEREGVDIVLVLDTSGSMATEDVAPNRFFMARQASLSLVSRLAGDRFALVAFEGDAYPLVPLTLDADAVGLFLDTLEPGAVPAPGTSLGIGLSRGLAAFVDKERRHKVMVLVSDGEDLEGEIDAAVRDAKKAGVVVHAVGVGTTRGQPVPDFDREGRRTGFKRHPDGSVVISRLNMASLEAIARGTGGSVFRVTHNDTDLLDLTATIDGMARKTLAREYSYRKKERFQWPLALGLCAIVLALLVPPPRRERHRALRAAAGATGLALALLGAGAAPAEDGASVGDELLLRPTRVTRRGQREYEKGDHSKALSSFEEARRLRPKDDRAAFNLADALYKNGKYDEAAAIYESLAGDARSKLAFPSRFNLGNALYQKQDYSGAVRAYRDALRLTPEDMDARRNMEMALSALQQQQQQPKQKSDDSGKKDAKSQEQKNQARPEKPKTDEEKEQERFEKETGMPKERAMQLLDALQRNEKEEQKRLMAERRADRKGMKDW